MEVLLKRPAVVEDVKRSSDDEHRIKTGKERQVLIESTRAEMVEVREENQRLKTTLAQIIKDYQSLQKHFSHVSHQQLLKKPAAADAEENNVSLSLGTSSSGGQTKDDKVAAAGKINNEKGELEGGAQLSLGLTCSKFEGFSSSSNPATAPKERPAVVLKLEDDNICGDQPPWPPGKTTLALKSAAATSRSGHGDDDDDDDDEASASQLQPQAKRPRVSVRTRCDIGPTMNDGCKWRKYGQKISKGNPCPRAYYRCTVAPACPVRKQVQRCAEDMSILITTYEGTHNHPLSVSATAMASTTAAAAAMLMSGSSSSQPAASAPINYLSSTYSSSSSYLPNSSISSSTSHHPTVTLDLTSPPQTQYFNRLSLSSKHPPSSTSFSFSSPGITSSLPSSWSSGSSYFSYGAQPYHRSSLGAQSYLQKTPLITDTIAKVITTDPKFQSALTAAISSYVEARGVDGA